MASSVTSSPIVTDHPRGWSLGPFLWSRPLDLALFGGSAALALTLVAVAAVTGLDREPFPGWGFILFVVGIDVAHVYATLFRTYLDGAELARHPRRYLLTPALVYAAAVYLYAQSSLTFWRVFAYVAVFHFVRQQVGWVAVYRARSTTTARWDRLLDEVAVYSSTLYPIIYWHATLESRQFVWFVQGDFVLAVALAQTLLPIVKTLWVIALVVFFARHVFLAIERRTIELGKIVVVSSTAAIWYVGIVRTNNDFAFTVTNVVVHGVPYFGLLWAYGKAQLEQGGTSLGREIVARGPLVFLGFLVLVAFLEELLWDRLVWHDRPWLFGESGLVLSEQVLTYVVPLLMLPQATHYVLDGMLWRRAATRELRAQRVALGFETRLSEGAR